MGSKIFRILLAFMAVAFLHNSAALALGNDELKVGINQEFESLNFVIATTAGAKYVLFFVYRPMIFLDADGKWKGHLAKEIPSLENKKVKIITKDGKKFLESTWEIKKEAGWGDGTPVTCKDLKLGWEVQKNPNVTIANRESATYIENVSWDEKNPKKCVVLFNKVRWDFYQNMPDPMPSHLEQPVLDQWGKQAQGYDRNTNYTKNPTNPGLFNGPYMISEVSLGDHLVLVPNPHFYGPAPKIKKILVRIITSTNTLEANLRSKNIDMIGSLGMTFDQAIAFEQKVKAEKLPYDVIFKTSSNHQHIDINLTNPILQDLKVRQALSYGFNKAEMGKTLFEDRAILTSHWMMPIDAWYTMDPKVVKTYGYDRKKAKQLLDEAGWKPGPDGYRYKDGKKLSLKINGVVGLKLIENVESVLQAQWKDLGVELLIKNLPGRLFFSEVLPKGNFDLALFSWSSFPTQLPESIYHSKNIPTEKNSWGGQNYPHWHNPKVDEAIEKATEEWDLKKQRVQVAEIARHYTEDIPVIPLVLRPDAAIVPVGLKNFEPTGQQYYESNKAEYWTF